MFNSLNSPSDAYWMLPMMGFAQLALFAGYSIYFPELFPTRLRGTGWVSATTRSAILRLRRPSCWVISVRSYRSAPTAADGLDYDYPLKWQPYAIQMYFDLAARALRQMKP